MNGVVYCIESPSGKKYVGQTINFKNRMSRHRKATEDGSNNPIHRASRKYGWENMNISILNYCFEQVLNDVEIFWISELETYGCKGYNLTEGGNGTRGYRRKHSEKTKQKISRAIEGNEYALGSKGPIGHKHTKETREKMSKAFRGRKYSEEARRNMSIASKKSWTRRKQAQRFSQPTNTT